MNASARLAHLLPPERDEVDEVADLIRDWKRPDYGPIWTRRTEALQRIRQKPAELGALKEFYAGHPAHFVTDWIVTFDPRLADIGLETTVPMVLFRRQREFIDWFVAQWQARQDGVVEKSRDMGVSWLCVSIAIWMWQFRPGTVFGFGSRKEDYVDKIGDPSSLFWKLRQGIALLPPEFVPKGYDERKHAPFMRVLNPENGSAIIGEAGDNIGRGGRTSVYVLDEAAFLEHPEAVDAALSQTSNCKIHVSTPKGEGNPFWRKRHEGKLPVFVFDWRQDPRKDEAWYAEQKRKLSSVVVAQEIDRDYSASVSNAFIPGTIVTAAMARGPEQLPAVGPIRFGLDVARFGDDLSVLTVRRGRVVVRQEAWGKTDLMSSAGRVRQIVRAYMHRGAVVEQIAVDTTGLGAGVADALREFQELVDLVAEVESAAAVNDDRHYNLRAFMWQQMKDWLENGASLPNDPDLRVALTGPRYEYRGGLLLLESKEAAKKRGLKSPDHGDSLALTFAKPGKPKRQAQTIPVGSVAPHLIDQELGL